MSVVGFDLGNESCIVAVATQGGIEVVLNDESKRETPAIVCFGDKQRFIGTAGAASTMMNPKNSISQIKRLIGRQFNDPELQRDIKSLPFSVTEGPDGFPLINARYLGEPKTFTPTQVLGMVLSDLKGIAEKNLNAAVVDCCIGIPVYFTDLQRRAVLDAATIAGLHPLRLIHETTATALAYGIYKTDLPENDQLNVAFVDIGHASMQVCIAGFKKGQLKVLAHSFDRSLGGRDFDEVLFQHFAAKFKEEYKIDVYQSARACGRLRTAVEKLKKMLSANPEAPLNIKCLMNKKDVSGFIKRDEFEQISVPILERVKRPLEKALADAGLTVDDVHTVEVVGSGSHVPAIIKILTEFFKKKPRRTMNASECVASGSALECAILSSTYKVWEFQVNESFPFPIALSWKGAASDTQNGAADNQQNTILFPKGNSIPSVRAKTFRRSSTFSVDVQYADVNEWQAPAKISTYTIGPFQSTKSERAKVKVKARLNLHGIVSIESATLLEEEEVEVPVSKEPAKEDTEMVEPKKTVKKTKIPVTELVYGGMLAVDVQKAVEKEFEMALQDRIMEETKDRKNAVEAYVNEMRDKLSDKYQDFVTNSEGQELNHILHKVEDWLYEAGRGETKGVYIAKLEKLKKEGDPIEERYKEYVNRGAVIDQFSRCINSYREAAVSSDPRFDHIDISEKQKVLSECVAAEAWLRDENLLLSSDVFKKIEEVDGFCKPIMMKPRAAPAMPAAPKTPPTPPPQGSAQQSQVIVKQAFTHSGGDGHQRSKLPAERHEPWVAIPKPRSANLVMTIPVITQALTHSKVSITSDFKNFIGEGGFGKVFLGTLAGTQVAVKRWSISSRQGYKEFQAELAHMMVHHKNLVSLVGYCDEGNNKALIYEYMANGDLRKVLSEKSTKILTWEERLKIALDAAQGLEYLHNGCKPPIVHRDVNTSNILLTEEWEAKLGDFGLSKVFPTENVSHVSTDAKGTHGYLDPEYHNTKKLNKASDIYSFGVVLLELVTGLPATIPVPNSLPIHISQRVNPLYEKRDIGSIVDPRLQGTYNSKSAKNIIETAINCSKFPATQRPKISEVCDELKKSQKLQLDAERSQKMESEKTSSRIGSGILSQLWRSG